MHSNLPLFFDGSPLIGLGLENSGIGFLFMTILDLLLLAAGISIYFMARKRAARKKEILPHQKAALMAQWVNRQSVKNG